MQVMLNIHLPTSWTEEMLFDIEKLAFSILE